MVDVLVVGKGRLGLSDQRASLGEQFFGAIVLVPVQRSYSVRGRPNDDPAVLQREFAGCVLLFEIGANLRFDGGEVWARRIHRLSRRLRGPSASPNRR